LEKIRGRRSNPIRAAFDLQPALYDSINVVQIQHLDRRFSDFGFAHELAIIYLEVL